MYQPKTIVRPVGRRGPFRSDAWDDSLIEMRDDIIGICDQANRNEASLVSMNRLLFAEMAASWDHAERHNEEVRAQHKLAAVRGTRVDYFVGFRAFKGPAHYMDYSMIPLARRARVEPIYGQAMLPVNMIMNRFYYLDPETSLPVVPDELDYTITGGNDSGGNITEGTPKYAFNGNNRDYWIRKVDFPLESDIDYVEATIDVTVPDLIIDRSNVLVMHPFPLGQLDVEEIKYSTDGSDPSTDLPGFTPVRGVGYMRWHFDDIGITKLRIKLRQRNFIEENGRKVFYLGAQEIGLQLMEFDKTAGQAQPESNNGVICVVEAPTGYKFDWLYGLLSSPVAATVLNETGIKFNIYTDENLTNLVWSSYTSDPLETTPIYVGGAATSKLYILVTLEYLQAYDMSPIMDWFYLSYTLFA